MLRREVEGAGGRLVKLTGDGSLCSAHAAGGQVLVSRTVRDLVTGSGIALQPRGEHELKGVPGAWELFAVGADTAPLPAPDQTRPLRPTDRVVLLAARRIPSLLRAASRFSRRRDSSRRSS
jgi:class 3 adenylate cyclase